MIDYKELEFVKSVLPNHYTVQESKKEGSIHCVSAYGLKKGIDSDDDEAFSVFVDKVKNHFGSKFQEISHNTFYCHVDFTIYLKQQFL